MIHELIDFWFSGETSKLWFNSNPAFDQLLLEKYGALWQTAREGKLDHWGDSAEASLALVILLDQFPLNMFRGNAQSFATEEKSREIASHALAQALDQQLPMARRTFLYMPFMHSEDLEDQARSVQLFSQPGLEDNLRFAGHHYQIIERFDRFPHRNKILGRESSEEELEYLNSKQAFKG